MNILAASLSDGTIIAYSVPEEKYAEITTWLKSLPVVEKIWIESLRDFIARRLALAKTGNQ